jgi:hypothetical protein
MPSASVSSAAGRAHEQPHAVTDVSRGVLEQCRPDLVARALLRAFQSTKLQHGLSSRLRWTQSPMAQLLGQLLEMKPHLVVEPIFE